jgi:UDP-2,4-diacetamido-2,4,6-trideoxy-beta-L-altropyranose hydrolase
MTNPVIVFRADGNSQMGLGHLVRSTALAEMLQKTFECQLMYRYCPSALLREWSGIYTKTISLANTHQDREVGDLIAYVQSEGKLRNRQPIVVLDGYHFNTTYQSQLINTNCRLVCIDDIYNYPFEADLVINHSAVIDLPRHYELRRKGVLAHGLAYSLLRTSFLTVARSNLYNHQVAERLFICFGGSDAYNISAQLVDRLANLGFSYSLDVVLGAANQYHSEVQQAAESYEGNVTIHQELDDEQMIALYLQARLAFVPASTILIEALAIGVPTVTGYYADNQRDIYRGVIAKNLSYGIRDWRHPEELEKTLTLALQKPLHLRPRPIDGFSNVNLRLVFNQLAEGEEILLSRPAELADAELYFKWVNDSQVRQSAIHTDPIVWKHHLRWFTAKVASPDSLLLCFSDHSGNCGQLRYDLIDNKTVILDISVDRTYRGRGLARRMLYLGEQQLVNRFPNITTLLAYVKPANTASIRSFRGAGFSLKGQITERGVSLLEFTKRSTG